MVPSPREGQTPRRRCPSSHCPVRATWLRNACGNNMPTMTRADRRGARRSAGSVLTALGLGLEEERQYQQLLPLTGGPAGDVATVLGTTEAALPERLRLLLDRGLVSLEGDRLMVLTLPALVARPHRRAGPDRRPYARAAARPVPGDPVPGCLGDPARAGTDGGAGWPRRRAERGRQRPAAAHGPDREQPGRPAVVASGRLAAATRVRHLGGGGAGGRQSVGGRGPSIRCERCTRRPRSSRPGPGRASRSG